jgi:hypothetical protein
MLFYLFSSKFTKNVSGNIIILFDIQKRSYWEIKDISLAILICTCGSNWQIMRKAW